jgi:hypothetical protein
MMGPTGHPSPSTGRQTSHTAEVHEPDQATSWQLNPRFQPKGLCQTLEPMARMGSVVNEGLCIPVRACHRSHPSTFVSVVLALSVQFTNRPFPTDCKVPAGLDLERFSHHSGATW